MPIVFALLILIVSIAFIASIVPLCQYLYHRFFVKDEYSVKYYFSENLFDRHMSHDVGLNDTRVIHNRGDMQALWGIEMRSKLP